MKHEDSVWSEGSDGASAPSHHSIGSVGSGGSVGSIGSRGSAESIGSRGSAGSAGSGGGDARRRGRALGGLLDRAAADMHCCTFRIGGQLFGLDVGSVGEVFQVENIVRVPLAPNGVIGLCNLRGVALAVIDLASVLELELGQRSQAPDGKGPALVLRLQGLRLAASIDVVESVFPVNSAAIRESDAVGEHPAIAGFLTLDNDEVVSVLDVKELTERIHKLRLRQAGEVGANEVLADEP